MGASPNEGCKMGIDRNERGAREGQGTRSGKPPNLHAQVAWMCELTRRMCEELLEPKRDLEAIAIIEGLLAHLRSQIRG